MPVKPRIAAFHDDLVAWRRDFHAHPEQGFEEHRTAAIDLLPIGASFFAALVEQELAPRSS